jgi:hypothetical protein
MKAKLFFAIVMFTAIFVLPVHAQEMATNEQNEANDQMVTYGTVVSVTAQQIVILEYDFDTDADVEATYLIDANTKLEAMKEVTELQVDDAVEIVYAEKGGVKTAQSIKKEDFSQEDTGEDAGVATEEPTSEAAGTGTAIPSVKTETPESLKQVNEEPVISNSTL